MKMDRLISQQQPSTSVYLEAYVPDRSRTRRPAKQPWQRVPFWQQAKDMCHWQPYSVQTQFPHSAEHGSSLNGVLKVSTCDEGSLPIQDPGAIMQVYEKAFEHLQQTNCRILAKAYIKLLEPRKQVNHPYNGRKSIQGITVQLDPEETKPSWWPSGVRHREPDHLLKVERIRLLIHIVRELHASHGLTVETLKVADQPIRDQIRPKSRLRFLEEIYDLRRAEERLLNMQTVKQPVKQPSSQDVFDKAERASCASGPTGCTDKARNSTQSTGAFVSDWAYGPEFNSSLSSFAYCGPLQHVTSRQGENCQDHGQLLTHSGQRAIPFHVPHSQWEAGLVENSSVTGSPECASEIPNWYGANALTQGERYKTAYHISASGPL